GPPRPRLTSGPRAARRAAPAGLAPPSAAPERQPAGPGPGTPRLRPGPGPPPAPRRRAGAARRRRDQTPRSAARDRRRLLRRSPPPGGGCEALAPANAPPLPGAGCATDRTAATRWRPLRRETRRTRSTA